MTQKDIIAQEADCASLGLASAMRAIENGDIDTDNKALMLKVNLPSAMAGFTTGNGEGIWAIPASPEDTIIYDTYASGTTFKVAILNTPIAFPFPWGSIIEVYIINVSNRPVLHKKWIADIIKNNAEDGTTLEDILN